MALISSLPVSTRREARFEIEGLSGGTARIGFESNVELDQSGQAWLPASLPILMASADDARFEGALDREGVAGAEQVQRILAGWYPQLRRVGIEADDAVPGVQSSAVGCFFSGGVDSFYSLLERDSEITHLIFVHGFDIAAADEQLAAKALAAVRAVAEQTGKTLITVRTDIRTVSDRWSEWGSIYHGAALATIGLLLSDHVGRIIVPSTFHTDALHPWGSHPDLDPLWSTSRMKFEHHGVSASRAEKIGAISSSTVALQHLRVCWEQVDGEYNCGRCSKCLRTMATLRVYGALEQCETFPSQIDLRELRKVRDPHTYEVVDARGILDVMSARGVRDPEVSRELRGLIRRDSQSWRALRGLRGKVRGRLRSRR